MDEVVLRLDRLSLGFQDGAKLHLTVHDLSLTLWPGQMLALVGESGSGKSLSALSILQLLPSQARVSQQSMICLGSQDLLQLSANRMQTIRGGRIGMIFQEALDAFNPVRRLGDQIGEVLRLHQGLKGQVLYLRGLALLEEVGLDDAGRCWDAFPHQLSGGMRQRAMIAMALAGDPDFLIADEPTTALDVTLQAQVMALLSQLKQVRNMGILFITHDLPLVAKYADDVALMREGKLLEMQPAKAFFQLPETEYGRNLLTALPDSRVKRLAKPAKPRRGLLKAENIQIQYGSSRGIVRAVDGVDLVLSAGETLAVVGESGSGKSTLARALMHLLPWHDGSISFLGESMRKPKRAQLQAYRQQVQMVFQDPYQSLNPRHLIRDIVLEGLDVHGKRLHRQKRDARALQLLMQVSLGEDYLMRYPHALSGGQRQRVAIARALALNPRVLICDEPTSALDVSLRKQVLDLLLDLQQQFGLGIILITHDFAVVRYMADRVMVMKNGRVVETGCAQTMLKQPQHEYTQALLNAVPG